MASGDATQMLSLNGPAAAGAVDATYHWSITKGGHLTRFTLLGSAVQNTAHIDGHVKCMYSDATNIYFGMGDGRLLFYVMATKAITELKRFKSAITSMSFNAAGTFIYITLANGKSYSYEV